MTFTEIKQERAVTIATRLNELCGTGAPTPAQQRMAEVEADEHIAAVQEQDSIDEWGRKSKP